jgi:hypothetical protein
MIILVNTKKFIESDIVIKYASLLMIKSIKQWENIVKIIIGGFQ